MARVKRRNGRGYRGRRRRRSKKSSVSLSARIKREIRKTAEKKYIFFDSGCNVVQGKRCQIGTDVPYVQRLYTGLTQGVTDVDRIGDEVTATSMRLNLQMSNSTATTPGEVVQTYDTIAWRVLVIETRCAIVTNDDIWERPAVHLVARTFDRALVKRVYYDRSVQINANGMGVDTEGSPDTFFVMQKHILRRAFPKVKGKMKYDFGSTSPGRFIYVMAWNDGILAEGFAGAWIRVVAYNYFIDT